MSWSFVVDDQLPVHLARWIASQRYVAHHVSDVGLTGKPDRDIWGYAKLSHCVIVTKDSDFSDLQRSDPQGPPVIWLRIGNTRTIHLLSWFATIWPQIIAALDAGERLIELR
jgi:predicted nuclease of predicted toxin-antitoxin system